MKKTLIIALLFSALFSAPQLTKNNVEFEIKKMLYSPTADISFEVLSIETIEDLAAVSILPPYREFPNVLIFQRVGNRWNRVFEGLSVGIIDEKSVYTDLHTVGLAADLKIGDLERYEWNEITRERIEAANRTGAIFIPYQNFYHFHIGGSKFYTIDKTEFTALANQLFDDRYEEYPTDNCMMYDLPTIEEMTLEFTDSKYILKAETANQQHWQISFEGVEQQKYLKNKKISVSK